MLVIGKTDCKKNCAASSLPFKEVSVDAMSLYGVGSAGVCFDRRSGMLAAQRDAWSDVAADAVLQRRIGTASFGGRIAGGDGDGRPHLFRRLRQPELALAGAACTAPPAGLTTQECQTEFLESVIGRRFALHMHYRSFLGPLVTADELADWSFGRIPVESWNCYIGKNTRDCPRRGLEFRHRRRQVRRADFRRSHCYRRLSSSDVHPLPLGNESAEVEQRPLRLQRYPRWQPQSRRRVLRPRRVRTRLEPQSSRSSLQPAPPT